MSPSIRIGKVEVEFPADCIGRGDLEKCPQLAELQQRAEIPEYRERVEKVAESLGVEACAHCTGVDFRDSDSGFTWTRECRLTGKFDESS